MKNVKPVTSISGIGATRARAFARIGINDTRDLIYHFPRAYENRADIRPLSESAEDEKRAFLLTVASEPSVRMIRRGMSILKFRAFDESASCEVTFFNQNYLKDVFHIGGVFRFYGKAERMGRRFALSSPAFEPYVEGRELKPFFALYPLTEGLTQKLVATAVEEAMRSVSIVDPLPEDIRISNKLCTLGYALENIHFPESYDALLRAKRRLVFDELFDFSLGMRMLGEKRKKEGAYALSDTDITPLASLLPYELTHAQKRVIGELLSDMRKSVPMSRIVVGDVGCGKTVCAAAAMYTAAKNGYQAALMAPTEILARQHYNDLSSMFESLGMRTALLVGALGAAEKRRVYEGLKGGDIDIVIGTQALLQDKIDFARLALVVTDEQHRFGVMQRAALSERNEGAHVLVMSATPIPRTLALVMYGDLDISQVDEMPPGRQRVDTFAVDGSYRERLYKFIRKNVDAGGQVYIVCPAVEESENESGELALSDITDTSEPDMFAPEKEEEPPLKAAVSYAKELSLDVFPEYEVGFVHGRMKSADKDAVMRDFAAGKIKILVSTTVIEVGVNVPSATLMIVENAERFGLSQLHQLRGRVGRGARKSYCVLVSDSKSEKAKMRLDAMTAMYDGYSIAERDLDMRGPGDFFASYSGADVRQHGGIRFRLADLCTDVELLRAAALSADGILKDDPTLSKTEHGELRSHVEKLLEEKISVIN